jgi:hypothetical protein
MLGLALKLLGGAGWLWGLIAKAARAIGEWIVADWRNGVVLVLALNFLAHAFIITPRLRADVRDGEAALLAKDMALEAERAAHRQTVADAQAAAKWAQDAAEDNARRVAAEQARATERIVDDYQDRLLAARARAAEFGRMQQARAASDTRRADATHLPGPAAAASRAGAASGEARLSDAGVSGLGAVLPMTLAERLIATEQALQLDALIDYVLAIAAIPNSATVAAEPRP